MRANAVAVSLSCLLTEIAHVAAREIGAPQQLNSLRAAIEDPMAFVHGSQRPYAKPEV